VLFFCGQTSKQYFLELLKKIRILQVKNILNVIHKHGTDWYHNAEFCPYVELLIIVVLINY